jgi:hypothetical protein
MYERIISAQKITKVDNIVSMLKPHSIVASVRIVPKIAKAPIIAPNTKNQIPESNTPSNIGKREERTGKSCPGYNILYITKKIRDVAIPITNITHEEEGSFSPCRN